MCRILKKRKEDNEVLDNIESKINKLGSNSSEAFPSLHKSKLIKGELKQEFMDDFQYLNGIPGYYYCLNDLIIFFILYTKKEFV